MALATNRRRHARIDALGLSSHLRVADTIAVGLPVQNISLGGMFVSCADPFAVGTRLRIELVKRGLEAPLLMEGKVVASVPERVAEEKKRKPGMGICFEPLREDAVDRLRDLLLELTSLTRSLVQENRQLREAAAQAQAVSARQVVEHSAFRALPRESELRDENVLNSGHTPTAPLMTMSYGTSPALPFEDDASDGPPITVAEFEEIRKKAFDFDFVSLDPLELPEPPVPVLLRAAPNPGGETASVDETLIRTPTPPSRTQVPPSVGRPSEPSADTRLKIQLQGLLLELGDARADLVRAWQERDTLREDNARLKKELARLKQWVTQLETMLQEFQGRTPQ